MTVAVQTESGDCLPCLNHLNEMGFRIRASFRISVVLFLENCFLSKKIFVFSFSFS